MIRKALVHVCFAGILLGCVESPLDPDTPPDAVRAAFILVDDGERAWRPVASNVPEFFNVWTSLAQSFTADDRRISFGFRFRDADIQLPNAGASIIYNLYAGENSYTQLLGSRSAVLPAQLAGDPDSEVNSDVGFVDVDFTAIELVAGQKYTVVATVPEGSLPAVGTTSGFGIFTSLSDPYAGGRFFHPVGYNNEFFADQDMIFRTTPASIAQILNAILGSTAAPGPGSSFESKLTEFESKYADGDIAGACGILRALTNHVRAQSGKTLSVDAAQQIANDIALLQTSVGC